MLKLRSDGFGFQKLINDLLAAHYSEKFYRPRLRRDKGIDGFLSSTRTYFAIYSPFEIKKAEFTKKINSDFDTARTNHGLKSWIFVYNGESDLPADLIDEIDSLKQMNSEANISVWSRSYILDNIVPKLSEITLNRIVGIVAGRQEFEKIQIKQIDEVLKDIIQTKVDYKVQEKITEVPMKKLEYNSFSNRKERLIIFSLSYTYLVKEYIEKHPDIEFGNKLSSIFKNFYYKTIETELDSNKIYDSFMEYIGEPLRQTTETDVAIQVTIAYFFEICDIFKRSGA